MPIWIAVELWDFGLLSQYINALKDVHLKEICNRYKTKDFPAFLSWLHMLNLVRNISAHHSRLWNRALTVTVKPSEVSILSNLSSHKESFNKVFSTICIIRYLLSIISPNSKWIDRVKDLIEEFPKSEYIKLSYMGFPEKWLEFDIFRQQ